MLTHAMLPSFCLIPHIKSLYLQYNAVTFIPPRDSNPLLSGPITHPINMAVQSSVLTSQHRMNRDESKQDEREIDCLVE